MHLLTYSSVQYLLSAGHGHSSTRAGAGRRAEGSRIPAGKAVPRAGVSDGHCGSSLGPRRSAGGTEGGALGVLGTSRSWTTSPTSQIPRHHLLHLPSLAPVSCLCTPNCPRPPAAPSLLGPHSPRRLLFLPALPPALSSAPSCPSWCGSQPLTRIRFLLMQSHRDPPTPGKTSRLFPEPG